MCKIGHKTGNHSNAGKQKQATTNLLAFSVWRVFRVMPLDVGPLIYPPTFPKMDLTCKLFIG